jgi:hypothetical protein
VVALRGCAGPIPSRDRQWAEVLTAAGPIVLFPDSFASRGLGPQCRVKGRRIARAGGLRRLDALVAATWLAAQPGTPPGGVAIMGWSDGGSTALATAQPRPDVPPRPAARLRRLLPRLPMARPGVTFFPPPLEGCGRHLSAERNVAVFCCNVSLDAPSRLWEMRALAAKLLVELARSGLDWSLYPSKDSNSRSAFV